MYTYISFNLRENGALEVRIGSNLDNKPGEDIVGIVNMRIPLHDEGVAALLADCMQSFSVSDHVYLVARPSETRSRLSGILAGVVFADGTGQEYEC